MTERINPSLYSFQEQSSIPSPALIYYQDILYQNLRQAICDAGGAKHLWPHVKTHKMSALIQLQMNAGICRFKCATIAETEMAASCGAKHVLLAYPLVGPNISRFLQLSMAFPATHFWAIGDDLTQLQQLGEQALATGQKLRLLIDVNLGMDRTGVTLEQLPDFYQRAAKLPGLLLCGLHCYDGHRTEAVLSERKLAALPGEKRLCQISETLRESGLCCDTIVLGGTPSMPCYAGWLSHYPDAYLSPGTLFVQDSGYAAKYPDLNYTPGAAILTRIISHPRPGYFTLDLGYKGISADPPTSHGILVGVPHAREVFQSEEHWTFCMETGHEAECPAIGTELFVLPTHICSTTALYDTALVVEGNSLCTHWEITARNRKLTF